ncbi:GNAT family N-acetyltransferase [Mucilaginibacter sp. AW1-3]
MPVHIREASLTDVEAICQIAHKTWWPTYSSILSAEQLTFMLGVLYNHEKISTQVQTGEQTFLILTEDDQVVAFAAYSVREENPDIYKLHKLYCLPQTQGKGYGKVLINEVISRVIAAGKNVLQLNVNRFNNARTFYEKMGFGIVYQEDIAIGDYWMNDFVMQKTLS